ncbi:hypothetical protein ACFSSB_09620 [Lacinutrix gracilariae]|uniref:DNA adenine methylase n=1 Tax=Lacinutrix gracilariae TaxID=1747198 RepID=A0ABW5K394_9FLAO
MIEVDLTEVNFSQNREEFRKEIITIFLEENPGTGKGANTSRYKYVVRVLPNGNKVYLSRPANFNNGFDFTLNVENTNFNAGLLNKKGSAKRASTRPTHENILADLRNKKTENTTLYNSFITQVELIYNCKNPINMHLAFITGHSSELLLECIKWLFEEQDVTYWNYSGRAMFYNAIKNI